MAAVNYIIEHETFIEYAKDNGITSTEQLLWYALIHLFNRRAQGGQWPDGFIRITNKTLLSLVPFGEDAMIAARNRLKQRGLIEYVAGKRNSDIPMYRMIYFSVAQAENPERSEFCPFKTGKVGGKEGGKPGGNPEGNLGGIYINLNEDENKTVCEDDDADDDDDARAQGAADREAALKSAWYDAFGEEPKPAEARRIVNAAEILDTAPDMVAKAVEMAAYNGARNPAPYIVNLLKIWRDEEISTPDEWAREHYLRKYDGGCESTAARREERRKAHKEGIKWQ